MVEGAKRSETTSYYKVLGVAADSSAEDIRRGYRKQAMRWHPDRWTKDPSLSGEAKRRFQQIQEAYSVLSDKRKRRLYDAGLYDPANDEEEDEGFFDFLQEMASLMDQTRSEEKQYSMEELQGMFVEMIQQFDWDPKASQFNIYDETTPRLSFSGAQVYPRSGYCN